MKNSMAIISVTFLFFGITFPAFSQDVAKGKRVWNKCRACHTLNEGGANRVGPNLYGVFDREAGTMEGFRFSKAMSESGVVWTEENIKNYLQNPRTYIKGTRMTFAGLRKDEDVANLLAYMKEEMGVN